MRRLRKGIRLTGTGLTIVAGILLLGMMFVGAGDVFGRYFFDSPITGAYEINSLFMGGTIFLAWAYTMSERAHVTVDIFFLMYRPRVRAFFSIIMMVLSLLLFIAIAWQTGISVMYDWTGGKLVRVILIPLAPFKFLVCLGAFFISLEIVMQIIDHGLVLFGKKEA